MTNETTIAEPTITIDMLPQSPEAYVRIQLQKITTFADAIIYWEEGAHTSSRWHQLLELCEEAEYYRSAMHHQDSLAAELEFIRRARSELSFWLRRHG